jgi:RimJ/RimL family protein N-acetyltransferase
MGKRGFPTLVSEDVQLRLLQENDLPLTLAWRNHDHIRKWFLTSDIIDPERHRAWFDQYQERDDDFVFIIEDRRAGGRAVGQVALYHIDWAAGRAEFGRLLIGEADAAGRGLAKAATRLLVSAAFDRLALREVYLEVLADNRAARAIYERCGFTATGAQNGVLSMARTPNPGGPPSE